MKTNKISSFHNEDTKIKIQDTTSFKKSYLKNGWGVKTSSGDWYTVTKIAGYGTAFINAETNEVVSAKNWNGVLQHKNSNKKNIILVAQPCDMQDYINKNYDNYVVVYKKTTQRGRKKKPATVKQLTA